MLPPFYARHAGDLLLSVRTWLERDQNTESAAKALTIHPNTLLRRARSGKHRGNREFSLSPALAAVANREPILTVSIREEVTRQCAPTRATRLQARAC